MLARSVALALMAIVLIAPVAEARDVIRIVGSSTVFPFATRVAEEFGKTSGFKAPIVESTGSGDGFKYFCNGVGVDTPDITDASRPMKKSEFDTCVSNGVTDITEVKIGFDGIVVANSRAAPQLKLTLRHLYLALAKDVPDGHGGIITNPSKAWNDVDPALPPIDIEVLGPPPSSGTRDAFSDLAMSGGCATFPAIGALKTSDPVRHKTLCAAMREDGRYVEAGENDILIVRKLEANAGAVGIFGFSFLDQNMDMIQGALVEGVAPTYDNIASAAYSLSRPLYFYVKKAHAGVIPGIREYISEFTSEKAWGPNGYLVDKGLIAMPEAERAKVRKAAMALIVNVAM